MNNRTFSIIRKGAAMSLLSLTLFSCIKEQDTGGRELSPDDQATVTVVIKSPGKGSTATRALEEWQEYEVKYIDVLLFEPRGKFFTSAKAYNIIDSNASNLQLKNFTVDLYQGTFDLVILANAGDIVSGASFTNLAKADALALLESVLPSAGKWPTDGTAPFPMWGDAGTVTIEDGKEISGPVQMLRMVARVDVEVAGDVGNFQLRSIDVYNYNTRGTVAPKAGHLTVDSENNIKVSKPGVPVSSELKTGPISYDGNAVNDKSCIREIYLFEAANLNEDKSEKALLDRTCLVVGGCVG